MLLEALYGIDLAYCPEEILYFLTVRSERYVSYVYRLSAVFSFSLSIVSASFFIRLFIRIIIVSAVRVRDAELRAVLLPGLSPEIRM